MAPSLGTPEGPSEGYCEKVCCGISGRELTYVVAIDTDRFINFEWFREIVLSTCDLADNVCACCIQRISLGADGQESIGTESLEGLVPQVPTPFQG